MKKSLLLLFFVSLGLLVSSESNAQSAKKNTLFEHFTNASCGPCASQNPIFFEGFDKVKANAHHISYHNDIPGFDPMYNLNVSEVNARKSYYGNAYSPQYIGNAVEIEATEVEATIEGVIGSSSPVSLIVADTELDNGGKQVTVTLERMGELAAGDYKLRVAIVQADVNYDTPPGSNGEREFRNVFRQMLPSTDGFAYDPDSDPEVMTVEFQYELNPEWDAESIYAIAFLQNDQNKEILNSGATTDLLVNYSVGQNFVQVEEGATEVNIIGAALNLYDSDIPLVAKISSNAPSDWAAGLTLDDVYMGSEAPFTMTGDGFQSIGAQIFPGATKSIAKYTITIGDPNNFDKRNTSYSFSVDNGVKELVVYNINTYNSIFTDGLTKAGTGAGAISTTSFVSLYNEGKLDDITSIYYNIGWTFPAFTSITTEILSDFLSNGGNLFVSGQDIGWDVMSGEGNGNVTTRSFYESFLQSEFIDDGAISNQTVLNAFPEDSLYGGLSSIDLATDTYGENYYPDIIKPVGEYSKAILNYNDDEDRVAGIRVDNGLFRVVYLGVGPEQFNSTEDADKVLKITRDWFNSRFAVGVFDDLMKNIHLIDNYPNPANKQTVIKLEKVTESMSLRIIDITGKEVLSQRLSSGMDQLIINTTTLGQGTYIYQLLNNAQQVVESNKMVVIH